MDNWLDKLGIYDFWGTFFPGVVGISILYFVRVYFSSENIYAYDFKYDLVMYIVFSYLLGIILHEIGHFIQNRIIYGKVLSVLWKKPKMAGEPFDIFLDDNCNILSLPEKKLYLGCFKEWQKTNEIDSSQNTEATHLFFNYCDYYVSQKGLDIKPRKMQSLYGMSRSLFVFFSLLSIMIFPYSLYCQSTKRIDYVIVLNLLIAIIFYFRMKRFNEVRLKSVMRTYIALKSVRK